MFSKQRVAILLAEFLGTAALAVSVYAVVSILPISLFAGMAAGLVQAVAILTFCAISGAHINPAVTIGFWSVGKIKTLKAIAYIVAQVLGAFAALYLIKYFAGQPVESIAGKFDAKAFTAEAVGAFVFTFALVSAVYKKYDGGKLAFSAGTALLIGILISSAATLGVNQLTQQPIKSNGIINPAVAVSLSSVNWAYIAGPVVGAIVGMNLYVLVFTDQSIFSKKTKAVKTVKPKVVASSSKKKSTSKTTKKRK